MFVLLKEVGVGFVRMSRACSEFVFRFSVEKWPFLSPCRVQKNFRLEKKNFFVLPAVCPVALGLRVVFRVFVGCVLCLAVLLVSSSSFFVCLFVIPFLFQVCDPFSSCPGQSFIVVGSSLRRA
jgi:hypothetical protein